ncbi:hypothetical protein VTO73DRAFT_10137 [Trametes versicolor]
MNDLLPTALHSTSAKAPGKRKAAPEPDALATKEKKSRATPARVENEAEWEGCDTGIVAGDYRKHLLAKHWPDVTAVDHVKGRQVCKWVGDCKARRDPKTKDGFSDLIALFKHLMCAGRQSWFPESPSPPPIWSDSKSTLVPRGSCMRCAHSKCVLIVGVRYPALGAPSPSMGSSAAGVLRWWRTIGSCSANALSGTSAVLVFVSTELNYDLSTDIRMSDVEGPPSSPPVSDLSSFSFSSSSDASFPPTASSPAIPARPRAPTLPRSPATVCSPPSAAPAPGPSRRTTRTRATPRRNPR